MRRMFGRQQPKVQGPSLGEATERIDQRVSGLDQKIAKLDAELVQYRNQMKKMRPGPAQNNVKQRALRVLKQKKMYEQQREQMAGQAFNMEQQSFVQQSMQDTVTTVGAMREASVAMKQQFKAIKIDDVEDLQDDLEDLYDQNNEIQESLSRAYGVPDDVDEADLEAELDALGDDFMMDEALGGAEEPSYLQAATAPEVPTGVPGGPIADMSGGGGAGGMPETDAYGLPVAAPPMQ